MVILSRGLTVSRRFKPVPTLKCLGGEAGCKYRPDKVTCIRVYDVVG